MYDDINQTGKYVHIQLQLEAVIICRLCAMFRWSANYSFQPYLYLYHLYLIHYDMTYHFFLCLHLRTQSVDLHFLPPRCERLLPAHPWPDQEWAYCGRQVRNCHSLFLASLTPCASQIMMFLKVSAETFLEQTLDLAEEGVLKSCHSGVCMCVLQVLPNSTQLKAHVHINTPTT